MTDSARRYSGMTTNERLAVAGLPDAFDLAIEARSRNDAIHVLTRVEFDPDESAQIVETIFDNPTKYGFAAHD